MSKKKQSPPVPRCALCKGFINILDNDYVVGSTGRMVCRGCLEMSFHILEASKGTEKENVSAPSITPQYIVQEVNKAIIGQEQAKSAVALAVWKQMLRANGDNFVPRTNLLLYGPSGCGKTAIIREAARIAGLPFLAVDATGITETGYRGKNAADIVTDLLTGFKGHPHVRHAIIFIDEVDKLSAHGADWRQAYCQGTQHALLKLVEGMEVTVDGMTINTTDLLFLFGGAFGRMREERKCAAPIGFVRSEPSCPSVTQHTAEDFCAYGMERELMGRIGRFVPVEQLTTEQMKRILTESSLSAFVKYKKFFRAHKVRLKLPDELVEQLACESVAQGTGARGLDGAVEALVQPLLYALAEGKLSGSVTLGGGIYGRVS
ncbi:MAG TPA: hypothetical protein DHW47_08420 [Oscillibacter sp.]|nr:hypothetical protein [Oscillibacter sp.]